MTNKLLVIILVLTTMIFSKTATTKQECALRDGPVLKTSEAICGIQKGITRDIIEEYSTYIKIKILSGANSNKEGWAWTDRLDLSNNIITGEGVKICDAPGKAGVYVCSVKGGVSFKILETKPTRYKIQGTVNDNWKAGWVDADYVAVKN